MTSSYIHIIAVLIVEVSFGSIGEATVYKATMLDLGPPYYGSAAYGIDGNSQVGIGQGGAVLWTGSANSAIVLTPQWALSAWAGGVSGNVQVGSARQSTDNYAFHAMLWHGNAASGVDINPIGWYESWAAATTGSSHVGRGKAFSGDLDHALLWNSTGSTVVDLTPSFFTRQAHLEFRVIAKWELAALRKRWAMLMPSSGTARPQVWLI